MAGALDLRTVVEVLQASLPQADPALVEENKAVFAFEATDGTKTVFTLDLTKSPGRVNMGLQGKPHAVFVATESDLLDYFSGQKSFQVLLHGRRLRVKGNMGKAARLRTSLLPPLTPESLAKYRRPKL
jgi:hypothetical protein